MKNKIRRLCRLLLALSLATQAAPPVACAEETAGGGGWIPRFSDFQARPVPDEPRPFPGVVSAGYTAGAPFAVWGNTLAFCDGYGDESVLYVYTLRDGEILPKSEYPERAQISNILLDDEGLAYLVGGRWDEEAVELVTVGTDGKQTRVPLGVGPQTREQNIGPLARLDDGRLLLADGEGILRVCAADGSGMRQVSDAPAQGFVYCDPYVYFGNLQDLAAYKNVYCYELDEYLDVRYPRLYRVDLSGGIAERVTGGGVRGLAARGPYILYQDIDDAYVWPQGELPEEWLYGVVTCVDGASGRQASLNLDSACYYPTALGLAAWLPEFPEAGADTSATWHEGDAIGFSLILHDWNGKPLCRLDSGASLWDEMTCFVAEDGIWVLAYDASTESFTLLKIPLDGAARIPVSPPIQT